MQFKISAKELAYLQQSNFLPSELAELLKKGERIYGGAVILDLTSDLICDFDEALGIQVQVAGFDEHQEINTEGRLLEALMDRLSGLR